ncbi:MAG: archaeal flagellar protein FlaJ [Candidatus Woesearchaeota archaeon]|nr:archaeal flagellar protein FlaJ [Candidatus Woesearchaeota archaeon]MDN5328043.1 archaeal flagellar protein FlaJ [Candidatus Woesearchaeota archaeon]
MVKSKLSLADLRRKLILAKINLTPKQYLNKLKKSSLMFSAMLIVALALFLRFKFILFYPVVFFAVYLFFFNYNLKALDQRIYRLRRELDKEVLFAGRYILLKVSAGEPLLNVLYDAANSYGVSGDFFKGLVMSINSGTPVEEALELAREVTPSEKFKKVLYPIVVSFKTGAEISKTLKDTLDSIKEELSLEIKAYGKKLNTIVLMYLILAVVFPSLGLGLSSIFLTFLGIKLNLFFFGLILFFLAFIQYFFIVLIRVNRPTVNL